MSARTGISTSWQAAVAAARACAVEQGVRYRVTQYRTPFADVWLYYPVADRG